MKVDVDDKIVVGFDEKLIALLRKKLVVVNKELDILKTIKLELQAFISGDELKEKRYHYQAGKN